MRKLIVAILVIVCFANFCLAEEPEYNGWADAEAVFAKALQIRALELEKVSGFKFDKDSKPKAEFDWILGAAGDRSRSLVAAEYKCETQTIFFVSRFIAELTVKYKTPLRQMSPAVLAKDDSMGELIDHELGHLLMDQISRRNKLGPWFTVKVFMEKSLAEQLGTNILSEGVAMHFQYIRHPIDGKFSEAAFPANIEEQRYYSFDIVAFRGGYWLVKDVLKKHGEKGLVWLIAHPFLATDNMREAAVLYRKTALHELGKKPK